MTDQAKRYWVRQSDLYAFRDTVRPPCDTAVYLAADHDRLLLEADRATNDWQQAARRAEAELDQAQAELAEAKAACYGACAHCISLQNQRDQAVADAGRWKNHHDKQVGIKQRLSHDYGELIKERDKLQADGAAVLKIVTEHFKCTCLASIVGMHYYCGRCQILNGPHPGSPLLAELEKLRAELKVYEDWDDNGEECFVPNHAQLLAEVEALRQRIEQQAEVETYNAKYQVEQDTQLEALRARMGWLEEVLTAVRDYTKERSYYSRESAMRSLDQLESRLLYVISREPKQALPASEPQPEPAKEAL